MHYLASVPKRETRGTAQKVHSPSAWCHHSCEQDSECGTPHPCAIQGCRRASNPPCPTSPPATLPQPFFRPRASCGHKGVTTAPLHPQWWCGKAHAVRNRWIGVGSFAGLPSLLDVYLTITSTQSDDGLKSITILAHPGSSSPLISPINTARTRRTILDLQFRALIIGRVNAGKTPILQRVRETTESPKIYQGGTRNKVSHGGPNFVPEV